MSSKNLERVLAGLMLLLIIVLIVFFIVMGDNMSDDEVPVNNPITIVNNSDDGLESVTPTPISTEHISLGIDVEQITPTSMPEDSEQQITAKPTPTEVPAKPTPIIWLDGIADIETVAVLAELAGKQWAEENNREAYGYKLVPEEYEIFPEPVDFYIDDFSWLYLNMKIYVDGEYKYYTCKMGYDGTDLKVWEYVLVERGDDNVGGDGENDNNAN